ncbi:MAG: response regulator [Lachnospiraceae bacterium]|nr:response regulator [Lachnospiraceae bacterium]
MSEPENGNIHTDKARILIVDDMQVNRTILSSMLSEHGITCDLAESGEKCLEMCQKGNYDMIILDHHMPDLDGVDTLVILKDSFRRSGIETPIICHTTAEGRGYANLYKAAGFSDILIKPVDETELGELIFR